MIFYFSATGNSYYAAKKIAEVTGDELYSIADCVKAGKTNFYVTPGENVGIICPTYFFGMPSIVHSFLCTLMLHHAEQSYFFALFTCGSETGNIAKQYKALMDLKVVPVHAIFDLPMVDNYVAMYEVPGQAEIERKLDAADAALDIIIQKILRKEAGIFNEHKGKAAGLKASALYPRYISGRRTKKFSVSPACIGCGRCEQYCPDKAIAMRDDMVPIWIAQQCTLCFGCINGCPARAIQYGSKTARHGRYMNPRVALPEPDPSIFLPDGEDYEDEDDYDHADELDEVYDEDEDETYDDDAEDYDETGDEDA